MPRLEFRNDSEGFVQATVVYIRPDREEIIIHVTAQNPEIQGRRETCSLVIGADEALDMARMIHEQAVGLATMEISDATTTETVSVH